MNPSFRRIAAIGAAMAFATVSHGALAQKSGGVLKIYHRDNPPSASILEEATVSTVMPFMDVYNNLVIFDQHVERNSLDVIKPDLATSWEWSEDAKDLTFKLRENVKWHDGQPFSAKDVKCTFDMLQGKGEMKLRKNPRRIWWQNLEEVTVDGPLQVTFHLKRAQPSFLALLASGYTPIYSCHVSPTKMRTHPIGTGPFKFVSFKPNESIKLVKNKDYWKKGKPYLDAIEWTIIPNRSTRILAFVAGNFDLTFDHDVTIPLLKDVKDQAPQAICKVAPSDVYTNLIVNRDKPPFDNAKIRRAMQLTIDRKAFIDILSDGKAYLSGAMLPPPNGVWGMPAEMLKTVPGYGDVAKSRAEAQEIMKSLGYGPDKMLHIKVSTRNIEVYRDPAVILIDQLKHIYIQGELEPIDTTVWHAKVARGDYVVGLNLTGVGVDDPDVNFYENYACKSERNYTHYCNPELEKLFDKQSMMTDIEKRKQLVWEIDKKLQEDGARPVIMHDVGATCMQPYVKGLTLAVNSIYNNWRMEDVWLDKK